MNKIGIIQQVEHGSVTLAKGFQAGGLHCGLKRKRKDLGWIYSEQPAAAAAVYTTNAYQAAPLIVTRESIAVEQKIQGVVVNSGNANACTGQPGLADAYEMRRLMADQWGIEEHLVAVASTGVIGERLPMEKVRAGIAQSTRHEYQGVEHFEEAILTTDTRTKHFAVQLEVDGQVITIGGAAKGSGMIHPNMATMLAFITTDACVEQPFLLKALREVTDQTFNMITVDGDTSTNDMILVLANGKANHQPLTPAHPDWEMFKNGLAMVCRELAKQIARDGEGATRLIEVTVKGAPSEQAARGIAKAIIGSNLVKTAVYGKDPNWGRIVCAIGYSGETFNPEQVQVKIDPVTVVDQGLPVSFKEEDAQAALGEETVTIEVNLNMGEGTATAWGCDLTYDYIKINALYRT
ncbi:bifunctional ornithine acetyltransferase/N-acetylglutamate synthase [Caldalkalibacillus thermarum TA2.A1]|uniref:Arginine biosynthesis bifunctional protein ArgJ n=1 Tax=Caldalkalibacillus thermarum (strain TA2.A1) TaxID=986075 RepID=A0A8X8LC92_CALTT|nr:bifunctional ornithine acetyltransferase/N-acetylglutamate synthase [Caldalkalibacillus thermarum]QZT34720.1 bifunctional ornithine acetyltransferase/N-acetylglutamate synthase [Caldalkalibacillus thermarum TA2.A1]